eukprot:scaffold31634_cov80-Skeletonema_dohrnii-CCMP3373.AAC.5
MASADNELRRALQDQAIHAEVGHHKFSTFGEGISNNSDRRLPENSSSGKSYYVNGRGRHLKNPVVSSESSSSEAEDETPSSSSSSEDEAPSSSSSSEDEAPAKIRGLGKSANSSSGCARRLRGRRLGCGK